MEDPIEFVRPEGGGISAAYLTLTLGPEAHTAALASLQRNCAEHARWLGSASTVTTTDDNRIKITFDSPAEDEEMVTAVIDAAIHKAGVAAKKAAENPSITGFGAIIAGFNKPRS